VRGGVRSGGGGGVVLTVLYNKIRQNCVM
jgi:hypothetical protein